MVFVADDLAAWLIGLLADRGRQRLTTVLLGTDQERALRSAATVAVRLTAQELRPGDDEQAEHVALVISQVFSEPTRDAPLIAHQTVLEGLQAGIVGQLAVLDDASVTETGQSSADVLDVPGAVLAKKLIAHLLREILLRGSRGGPLFPLASQLNDDATHLQGQRLEGMLGRLVSQVQTLVRLNDAHTAAVASGRSATPKLDSGDHITVLDDYRKEVALRYGFLTLAGIPVETDNLRLGTIRLNDVYIRLEALPERGKTQEGPVTVPIDTGTSVSNPSDAVKRQIEALWQQLRLDERPGEYRGSVAPEEAVEKGPPCVVILGIPGAGKSTMMRMLAVQMAASDTDLVPLYVRLSEVDLSGSLSLREVAINQALSLFQNDLDKSRVRAFLDSVIDDNRACFLFDGMDEVFSQKEAVWEELRSMGLLALSGGERLSGARIVVTSRPTGYRALPFFSHYRILPLLPRDSHRFLTQWFTVLASVTEPSPKEPHDWVQDNTAWLTDQLEARPQLRDIASNPLMLTFLALYVGEEPRKKLPEHRKDVYREYVERLFAGWESRRTSERPLMTDKFRGDSLRDFSTWFIYQVARRVHEGYYGVNPDDSPTEQKLVAHLKDDLQDRWHVGEEAVPLVKECLAFWRTAGLLRKTEVIQGREWYLFRHQTFQEYGTARALAERYSASPDDLWTKLQQHRREPAWSEVIPLALGCLADFGHKADSIVRGLLDEDRVAESPENMGGVYLAARCVADGAIISDELLNDLLNDLLTRISGEISNQETAAHRVDDAFSALVSIGWKHPSKVLSQLSIIAGGSAGSLTQLRVAEAQAKLQPRSVATRRLFELASDRSLDPDYRLTAAWTSGRLGNREDAVELIRDILRSGGYAELVVTALGEMGTTESYQILREIGMDSQRREWERIRAAEELAKVGLTKIADEILTSIIENSKGSDPLRLVDAIRQRAVIRGNMQP